MKMKKIVVPVLIALFLTSCSIFRQTISDNEEFVTDSTETVSPSIIVNEKLENAREHYVDALYQKKLGFKAKAINEFEQSLIIVN